MSKILFALSTLFFTSTLSRAADCPNPYLWENISGSALDLSAGADGGLWHVGLGTANGGFSTWQWVNNAWVFRDGAVLTIAAGPDGRAWGTNESYEIYYYENGWNRFPGAAQRIAVGSKGQLWAIGLKPMDGGHEVMMWTGKAWEGRGRGAKRIAVGPDGEAFVVTDSHEIFRSEGAAWKGVPGLANDIAIGPAGEMWMIDVTPVHGGFLANQWQGPTKKWVPLNGGGISISIGTNGTPYLAKRSGTMWRGVKCVRPDGK